MKKTIIFVCTLLAIITTTNAQTKNNVCGKIRYSYIRKTDLKVYAEDEMVFNNTISYSKEIDIKRIESEKTKTESDEGITTEITIGRKNLTPVFCYNTKKEFYFSEVYPKKQQLSLEEGILLLGLQTRFLYHLDLGN